MTTPRVTLRVLALALPLAIAFPAMGDAQNPGDEEETDRVEAAEEAEQAQDRQDVLQHFRPYDRRGINMFEEPRDPGVPYDGFEIYWGASFTQQFQALDHTTDANVDLLDIGPGFNLATADLYLGAQLAEGIRVHLETYLSSRGHPEAWVKGGYLLMNESPLDMDLLHRVMDYTTLRVGHFGLNYGDAQFRRSDNAHTMHNPFVGNLIMDGFTTEIGAEVYLRGDGGWLAMVAMTDGEIQGRVDASDDRSPSLYGKLGFDRELSEDVRVRLTGSAYTTSGSASNTLYFGDRAGSRYYAVMVEEGEGDARSPARTGRLDPAMRDQVTAFMVNPFVQLRGLELFGTVERAEGRSHGEEADRTFDQYAGEAVYRFLEDEFWVGARYNTVSGEQFGTGEDISVDRFQLSGGWFITDRVSMKAEYVTQSYNDFPTTDLYHGGEFDGLMVEAAISF